MVARSLGEARTFADFLALPDEAKLAMVAQVEETDGPAAARNLAVSLGLREAPDGARGSRSVALPATAQATPPAVRPSRKALSLERRAERLEAEIAELPPAEQEAAREAARRVLERRRPHAPMEQGESGEGRIATEFGSSAAHAFRSRDAFGTASHDFATTMMTQLGAVATGLDGTGAFDAAETNAMVAAVEAVRPENEVEAMLAVQMVTAHRMAMAMMARVASAKDQAAMQGYGTLATKLLRTFPAQTEALAKLRRKGEQTVRVEHVHVYQGGQAIVGHVATGGGRGGERPGTGHQAHATDDGRTPEPAGRPPVRGTDAGGHTLSGGGRGGQAALPDARGRRGKRVARGT